MFGYVSRALFSGYRLISCPHRPCGFVGAYCMPLFCFTPFLPPLVGYAFLAVGLSLIRPFAESAFVGPRCLSVRVCLCAFALRVSSLCVLFFSPFALGLCDVWLWCCGCFPPSPLGCIRAVSWPSNFLVLLVPPSGYLVASATAWLPCLVPGVLWCIVSSLHFVSWQQRLWPCVG